MTPFLDPESGRFVRINPDLFFIINNINEMIIFLLQAEISKRLNAIIGQILPFLSQEHQQQVATAVDRAKQITMSELNSIIGVSAHRAT